MVQEKPDGSSRKVLTTRWYGTIWVTYDGSSPFNEDGITVETKYDRNDKSDFITRHTSLNKI